MSRRKQAKPRALKRGEWDDASSENVEMGIQDSPNEISGSEKLSEAAGEDGRPSVDGEEADSRGPNQLYRCESCGLSLESLKSFMDHRNFDCVVGVEDTLIVGATQREPRDAPVAMETENSMESEGTARDPPSWHSDTPDDQSLSPSSCATPTDPDIDLNYTIGVTESTPYPCQFCDKAFPRLSYLKRHEQSHGDQMPFKCDFCHRLFKHKRSRDRHVKLHTGDKKYRCPHCDSAFSRSDHLKIHMKTHDNAKPFQCTICNRGYNTPAALTSHMQNHKKDTLSNSNFRCMQCTAIFQTSQKLQEHIVTHSSGSSSPNHDKLAQCPLCPHLASNQEALASHVEKHHQGERLKCHICVETFHSAESLYHHLKVHPDVEPDAPPRPRLACMYCTKDSFTTLEALQLHVQAMHGALVNGDASSSPRGSPGRPPPRRPGSPSPSQQLNCEYCTMRFSSIQGLQKHTLSVHSFTDVVAGGSEAARCPHCTMAFPGAAALREHVQLVHEFAAASPGSPSREPPASPPGKVNGEPPGTLLCSQCNAAFPDFEAFRTHLKTHLDEVVQKFVCAECQGEFGSEEQLDGHAAGHYLATATEYGCQSCLKLFAKPDELQKHLMDIHAHHLYRCSLCKEVFDSKVSVQVHFAVKHSNECKLFKCTSCSSVFRSEMEFQLHVKVAHLRKAQPFRCLFCNFSYNSELELQCHLTTHKKQFACALCDEAFHVEFLLDRHMQSKHAADATPEAGEAATEQPAPSSKVKPKGSPAKKELRCDICDAELASEAALNAHRRQAHNIRVAGAQKASQQILSLYCAYCSEACKSRTELENHMKVHTVSCGKHKCNICDEVCPTASTLAEHKLTHCKVVSGSMCVSCKVNLKSEDQYYSHLQQHNSQGLPLPCVVCRQTLMSEVEVQMHVKFHLKNAEPLFPCCLCLKQFETMNLIPHGAANGAPSYVCKECFHRGQAPVSEGFRCADCKVKFESQPELEQHRAVHKKTYQCIKCQTSFDTESEIQLHVASHMLHEGTSHECQLCHKVFDSPAKLQCHLIEHTFEGCGSYSCYMCSAVFTTAGLLQKHMLEHGLNSRPYDCGHCHQRFFFRAEFENHLFAHPAGAEAVHEGELRCPECPRTFASAAHLATHRKAHRPKGGAFKCSLCPDAFKSSADMQRHYFKAHGDAELRAPKKPFRCAECGDEFPCLSNLQGHARTHTQGHKYTCPECGKDFALARNLGIHLRSHSGEKPYECPVCSKRFARKENRKAHLKSHSGAKPFVCPHCGKAFSRKCHVKEHMRVHAGAPGSCELCPEAAPDARALRRHMVDAHGKEYPFACPLCDEPFERPASLRRHLRRTHDEAAPDDASDTTPSSDSGDTNDGDNSEGSSAAVAPTDSTDPQHQLMACD